MKSGWDRLHGKLVMYRALIIYRLNTRILGDLYRFHVEKGALITDHVEYKLPTVSICQVYMRTGRAHAQTTYER